MEIPDDLLTVFSADIETRDGTAVITVPERELAVGRLERDATYRVAILPPVGSEDTTTAESDGARTRDPAESAPPVESGDTLDVEVEDVGDQGDGIARIGPGYIVFVPDTTVGDRVTIEITEARQNFAFAEVLDSDPVSG